MALVGDKTSARVVEALLVLADQVAVERLRLEPVEAKVANQVLGALKHFLALAQLLHLHLRSLTCPNRLLC